MIKFNNIDLKNDLVFIIRDLNIIIPDGELFVLVSLDNKIFNYLYNLIKGYEKNFSGSIEVDETKNNENKCFLLPWFEGDPEWTDELKTNTIIKKIRNFLPINDDEFSQFWTNHGLSFFHNKKFSDLNKSDKIWLAFCLFVLKRSGNYIFNDILKGQPHDLKKKVKKVFAEMKNHGETILYLTEDIFLAAEIADRIGLIKNGRLETIYTAAELKDIGVEMVYKENL